MLVHGDITEDHLYFCSDENCESKWNICGLIDFGDVRMAPKEYEWIALWFGALQRNQYLFKSFIIKYHHNNQCKTNWKSIYNSLFTMTLLHEYGLEIIVDVIHKNNKQIHEFDSFLSLLHWIWKIPK